MTILYMSILFVMTVVIVGGTVWCAIQLAAPKPEDAASIERLAKSGEKVIGTYKKIESDTVGAYKAVESGVVGAYQKIEDGFVEQFLTREGETVEAAKTRLKGEGHVE